MKEAKRAVIIGLDAAIIYSVKKYADEGSMPNVKRLIENGVWAKNCLVPFPTITPPNWTTIVTGSWPGTHGITCFHLQKKGRPLGDIYQAFRSSDVKSEYIWVPAEKLGKRTILLNYPTTWPPTFKNGIQIGGGGLSVNEWKVSLDGRYFEGMWETKFSICGDQLVATEEYPFSKPAEIKDATGFKGADPNSKMVEVEFEFRRSLEKIKEKKIYYLLIISENGKFNKVYFCRSKDINDSVCSLRVGQWSDKIYETIETQNGKRDGVFKCKLLELSGDGKQLKFYISPICQLDAFVYPDEIKEEIKNLKTENMPIPIHASVEARGLGWIDYQTLFELYDMEHAWYSDVASHLFKNHEWSLFFMHAHCPDACYHAFINELEKPEYENWERRFYNSLDNMIGKIVSSCPEDTLVIITSDHGATPTEKIDQHSFRIPISDLLEKAGLLFYKEENGRKVVDWERTKANQIRSVYIHINLKGRDPNGIVEPKDYEKIQEKIINLLYDYTDPKLGKKPIAFALKKDDARMIGLYGDEVGDVIFGVKAEVLYEHGYHIPTGEYGRGSIKGLLIMSGPNIKKGYVLERTVWLTDITPTICYLLGLPVPRDCEGAIIYQALEDPDFMIKKYENIKKNYERLKKLYNYQTAQTHTY